MKSLSTANDFNGKLEFLWATLWRVFAPSLRAGALPHGETAIMIVKASTVIADYRPLTRDADHDYAVIWPSTSNLFGQINLPIKRTVH